MKLRVSYTVELDRETVKVLLDYARIAGFDFGDPSDREILRRLFESKGTEAELHGKERMRDEGSEP